MARLAATDTQLAEARQWIEDRPHSQSGLAVVTALSDEEVLHEVHRRYPGGWTAFIQDEQENAPGADPINTRGSIKTLRGNDRV